VQELKDAFEKTRRVREAIRQAQELADEWLFETGVRLHRAGEGAPYSGLKPAGLDCGPVLPRAEKAIETDDATEAISYVLRTIEEDLQRRFTRVVSTKSYDVNNVSAGREYVHAYADSVVYAHHLYAYVMRGLDASDKQKHHCA
jgi:hypothetical protein